MASNSKNLAELLNSDVTLTATDIANGAVTTAKIASSVNLGRRNLYINGDMRIDQRGSASVSAQNNSTDGTQFVLDRINTFGQQGSKFTAQRLTGGPDSFQYYLRLTSTSAYTPLTGDRFMFRQGIEAQSATQLRWGYSDAKDLTLSFWVRSSLTGTFGGTVKGQGGEYVYSYTIDAANTWEYKTVTIPAQTGYAWTYDSSALFHLWFSIGHGATYAGTANTWTTSTNYNGPVGQTNVVATNGATWDITGIQLEVGDTATPFEHRPYGEEEALCQRFFYASTDGEMNCVMGTSTEGLGMGSFPTKMRVSPTVYASGGGAITTANIRYFNGSAVFTTFTTCSTSSLGIQYFSVVGSGTQGLPVRPFPLWFDAEL